MRTEIAKLHENIGSTTIYVTHDQTEAMTLATRIVIMNAGVIQQIGTPFDVYNTPNNKFVAGFIGSPSMNFHNVTYSNGRITDGKGLDLPVTTPRKNLLDARGYEGKEVIFGIRPEDIHAEQIFLDTSPETTVNTTIVVAELTGADSILHLDIYGTEVVAVVDARDHHEHGAKIETAFDMNKAHFFDSETEEVIR